LDLPLGGGLNFKLVTENIELDRRLSSRGTAFFDYDNDGDIDLLVTHMDAPPTLLRNDTVGSLTLVREVRSGGGYISPNDLRAHFGLGEANLIDHLWVKWSSRSVPNLYKITPLQTIHFREPQD